MQELTIEQIWQSIFNVIGAIKATTVMWGFNFFTGVLFAKFGATKFWRGFGWFGVITGGIYLLALLITKL